MRAKQSHGNHRLLCRCTQGRNLSSSFFVNLDSGPGQGKKLWHVLRVYFDPEIDLYCCRTIATSSKKSFSATIVCTPPPPSWGDHHDIGGGFQGGQRTKRPGGDVLLQTKSSQTHMGKRTEGQAPATAWAFLTGWRRCMEGIPFIYLPRCHGIGWSHQSFIKR